MQVLETSEIIVIKNSKDEEDLFQREIFEKQSRKRLRKINHRGEHQTITDNVNANNYLTFIEETEVDADWPALPEAPVNPEDEEDENEDIDQPVNPLLGRDFFRECLEKEPADKTDDDIEQLLEVMHQLPAFADMTMSVRRQLCSVMIFKVVDQAGTVILEDGKELDALYIILNGTVEITYTDGKSESLCMGNSFGIIPTLYKQYMNGVVKSKEDDCQATPEQLILHLIEEHSVVDPTYTEDYLLTYRTFIETPLEVCNKLLEWFKFDGLRDKVTRVVILWVNNHFCDFEGDPSMTGFLEEFEKNLENTKMKEYLHLLDIACAAKGKWRQITFQKTSWESPLFFSLIGGSEGFGIFLEGVELGSKAAECGLKRGDQIMEVNGQNFENITLGKALEILENNTHLSLTLKANIFVFKELISRTQQEKNDVPHIPKIAEKKSNRYTVPDIAGDMEEIFPQEKGNKKIKAKPVSGERNKIR